MNGFINVYKPKGLKSMEITRYFKRKLNEKAGHIGTLDPLAEGVLPIAIGGANKLSSFIHEFKKTYKAKIRFGITTDSDDITGNITNNCEVGNINIEDIVFVLRKYKGKILQKPPSYSALKIKGKRAYSLARKGVSLELAEKEIEIFSIELISFESPYLDLKIDCSKGTYIRSLARDIGNDLGVGGCLDALERLSIGDFNTENAIRMDEFEENRDLVNPLSVLKWSILTFDKNMTKRLSNGNSVIIGKSIQGTFWMQDTDGRIFGFGKTDREEIKPLIIFDIKNSLFRKETCIC